MPTEPTSPSPNGRASAPPSPIQVCKDRREVAVGDIRPNGFNYNTQPGDTFQKLVESIRRFGWTESIVVRTIPGVEGFEIVNGEHRWRAAQLLGMSFIPITNMGDLSDEQAKQLCIILNELGGKPDEVRLADLLRDISKSVDFASLSTVMPYSERELDNLLKEVNFSSYHLPPQDVRPPDQRAGRDQPVTSTAPEAEAAAADDDDDDSPPPADGQQEEQAKLVLQSGKTAMRALKKALAAVHPDPFIAVQTLLEKANGPEKPKPKPKPKKRGISAAAKEQ